MKMSHPLVIRCSRLITLKPDIVRSEKLICCGRLNEVNDPLTKTDAESVFWEYMSRKVDDILLLPFNIAAAESLVGDKLLVKFDGTAWLPALCDGFAINRTNRYQFDIKWKFASVEQLADLPNQISLEVNPYQMMNVDIYFVVFSNTQNGECRFSVGKYIKIV